MSLLGPKKFDKAQLDGREERRQMRENQRIADELREWAERWRQIKCTGPEDWVKAWLSVAEIFIILDPDWGEKGGGAEQQEESHG